MSTEPTLFISQLKRGASASEPRREFEIKAYGRLRPRIWKENTGADLTTGLAAHLIGAHEVRNPLRRMIQPQP
jgi:hypothetical protein